MVSFYMMVGLPASGKSTAAHCICAECGGDVVVSSDAIRAELYGDEAIQGDPNKIFNIVKERIVSAIRDGKDVVMDATNINSKKRAAFLVDVRNRCRGIDIEAHCVVMATPVWECIERDSERSRHVGREVIERMWYQFEVPHKGEGWQYMHLIYPDVAYLADVDEYADEMRGFDQQNPHHSLDLYDHCFLAAQHLLEEREDLYDVGMFHDIGKLHTKTFDDEGIAHYYNHDNAGAYVYLTSSLAKEMRNVYDSEKVLYKAGLICWHMQPYFCNSKEDFYIWALKRGMSREFVDDIWLLHEADRRAH
jgi:predicted kinase